MQREQRGLDAKWMTKKNYIVDSTEDNQLQDGWMMCQNELNDGGKSNGQRLMEAYCVGR